MLAQVVEHPDVPSGKTMPNPANIPSRREADREIATILARLDIQDKTLAELKAQNECILEGINGTAETKGLAGHVRDYKDWRGELEKDETLLVQLEKIKAWQNVATRIALGAFALVGIPIISSAIALLWLLINHQAEIILH